MFHPRCQPRLLLGIGHLEGPLEPETWLKIPHRTVPNNTPLAEHLMKFGFERGFDWAISKTLVLDHSTMVPIHLAVPADVRAVPVYISSGMEPIISGARCKQLGQMLGDAIRSWRGNERVAILGTGGISHWVGMARNGDVNEEFDRRILSMVERGDIDGLVALGDEEVIEQAGNGALEIRNWIVAMSAMSDFKAGVMAYEPVPPWITGLGFVELAVPA
jgi:protocatechuate 4,5-dioxygenase beta chain